MTGFELIMRPRGLEHRISLAGFLLVCCLVFSNVVWSGASPNDEKSALLEFKSQISGDPLNVLGSWSPSDQTPCNWTGVSCDENGNVERIILQNRQLSGTISPELIRLKYLRTLSLSRNGFSGKIPLELTEIGSLWKLNLSHNAFSGAILPDLGNLSSLRMLDLSGNSFSGTIPSSLFKYCSRLRYIALSNNHLSGPIPTEIAQCGRLEGFDFSLNGLNGNLPTQICTPRSMAFISVRRNFLVGVLPKDLGGCQSLQFLDLGGNSFSGSLPNELLSLKNLVHVAVNENFFTDSLLPNILALPSLGFFNISYNNLTGKIPVIPSCSSTFQTLDLSGNKLAGQIPSSFDSCINLRVLDLSNNRLTGSIPSEIGSLAKLSILRLGRNNIDGFIPSEIGKIELLQILDLHDLLLRGGIPTALTNCRFLLELDASGNSLDGPVPEKVYNITYLSRLDLHDNRINGIIPPRLGDLNDMKYLDLSKNMLTGMIPPSLGKMSQLVYFNVSFNHLSGPIPNNPIMQKFGRGSFIGNAGLCGPPLGVSCRAPSSPPSVSPTRGPRMLTVSAIIAIVAAAVISVGVCIITLMNLRALRRKKTELLVYESTPPSPDSNLIIGKLVLFSKSLPSKYEDWEAGTKALLDKECLIGVGAIGAVYKAAFDGGLTIAVKKLETLGRIKVQEEFEQEIGRLGNLRHPNLVALQGYYWSSTMQLILSDFIPNGSLYHHLHEVPPGQTSLCWARRFRIALGTAKALAYLHHDCKPRILHFDIKSTNILIDDDFEPRVSDYGLGKLLPMLDTYISSRKFHTAVGYVAPELACQSLRLTEKCDVYSFGVIVLELITGRRPVESSESEVVILCEYVRSSLEKGEVAACIDPNIQQSPENEIMQVLKLGLICTSQTPSKRPSMAEVVQVLESIKPNLES